MKAFDLQWIKKGIITNDWEEDMNGLEKGL